MPIVGLVTLLCFLLVPMPSDALAGFVFGALLLLIGMGMFNLGADMAMTPIGESVGANPGQNEKMVAKCRPLEEYTWTVAAIQTLPFCHVFGRTIRYNKNCGVPEGHRRH